MIRLTSTEQRFARNLRTARQAAQLRLIDLARLTGTTATTLCNYECGKASPRLGLAVGVANALDIPLTDLLEIT